MIFIWNYLKKKNLYKSTKTHLFITLSMILYSSLGFICWLLIRHFFFNTKTWAICFIGYPGLVIGYIGGVLYLYNHCF